VGVASTIDLSHDKTSIENNIKVKIPVLVLWGKKGKIYQRYNPLPIWQRYESYFT